MESKKKQYKWTYKIEIHSLCNLWLPGERGGIVREFGMDTYTLLYSKWITNKDWLYSTWDSAQDFVAAWMGGGFRR